MIFGQKIGQSACRFVSDCFAAAPINIVRHRRNDTWWCSFTSTSRFRRLIQSAWFVSNGQPRLRLLPILTWMRSNRYENAERLRKRIVGWRRGLLLALTTGVFSFTDNGITDEDMNRASELIDEFDKIQKRSSSLSNSEEKVDNNDNDNWELVIDESKLRIWRRPLHGHAYLYEYKCAATYDDVSAKAFLMAQMDLDHRRKWDDHVIVLDVIDRDETTGAEVVRWVTRYPYPMYPREYIYVRRVCIDSCENKMIMLSRAVDHHAYPITKTYLRVQLYSSNMVIRPHLSFDQVGMDYILTYCDDPKSAIPNVVYSYLVNSGVPGFMRKVHDVAIALQKNDQVKKNDDIVVA